MANPRNTTVIARNSPKVSDQNDLVAVYHYEDKISVLPGRGDDTFEAAVDYGVAGEPRTSVAGDKWGSQCSVVGIAP